jgi:hypothetical protein
MVLDGKGRQPAVADALHGVVVQVDVGHLDRIGIQTIHIHGKPMILGGDFHLAGDQVLDRLVGSPVAEFQLVCAPPRASPRIWLPKQMPKMGSRPSRSLTVRTP